MLYVLIDCKVEEAIRRLLTNCDQIVYSKLYPYIFKYGTSVCELTNKKLTITYPTMHIVKKCNSQYVINGQNVCEFLQPFIFTHSFGLQLNDISLSIYDKIEIIVNINNAIKIKKLL